MVNPITGEDILTLTWESRCASCGCHMPVGTKAAYTKLPTSKLTSRMVHARIYSHDDLSDGGTSITHTVKTIKPRKVVQHTQADGCGSRYTIKAIYHSTSKTVVVPAYTAQEALASILVKHIPVTQPVPSCYIVYQGNVPVLTHINRTSKCGCAQCQWR